MNETDNKTEDSRADLNKAILDAANKNIVSHLKYQDGLSEDQKDVDWMFKVSRDFAGRVLLDDGKNTANIGLAGGAGGFNVTFIETVAGTATVAVDSVDDDDLVDTEEGYE